MLESEKKMTTKNENKRDKEAAVQEKIEEERQIDIENLSSFLSYLYLNHSRDTY